MPLPLRWRMKLDRFRETLVIFLRGEKEAARPRLCPACRTLVGTTATTCHACGASLRFSLAAASRSVSRLMPEASPASYGILTFTGFLFVVSLMATLRLGAANALAGGLLNLMPISGAVLERLGASLPLPYEMGEPWRVVTAVFLHGSLAHFAMNMWVLMDVGPVVEEIYGSARYLFLYVVTGIAGFALSSYWGHSSIGASGALLGLIGVMLAITWGRKSSAMQSLRSGLIRWLIYIAVIGLVIPGIDNWAHLGGFVSGFALGRVMADRKPADAMERKRAYAMGWAAGLVVALSFAVMLVTYLRGA